MRPGKTFRSPGGPVADALADRAGCAGGGGGGYGPVLLLFAGRARARGGRPRLDDRHPHHPLEQGAARARTTSSGEENWTLNGPLLDGLTFIGGLEHDKRIVQQRRKADRKVPNFRADMSPPEIASMIETFYRIRAGSTEFDMTGLQPRDFLGHPGFQFDYDHLGGDEVERQGRAVGAIVDGPLLPRSLRRRANALFPRRPARVRADRGKRPAEGVVAPDQRRASAAIASALANSAGSTSAPEAAAFSASCSGREAPTMAEATFGSLSTQASANWARLRPASAAIGRSRCTASRGLVAEQPRDEAAHLLAGRPAALRRRAARPVLAGEDALSERRPDDLGDSVRRAERNHLLLRLPPEQRILRLAGDELLAPAIVALSPGRGRAVRGTAHLQSTAARILSAGHSEKPI